MPESQTETIELPHGLAWSNTLATIDGAAALSRASDGFRDLLEKHPDDEELRERVRTQLETFVVELRALPNSEQLLFALGDPNEICGPRAAEPPDGEIPGEVTVQPHRWLAGLLKLRLRSREIIPRTLS